VFVLGLVVALAAVRYVHDVVKLVIDASTIDFATYWLYTSALLERRDPFDPPTFAALAAKTGLEHAHSPPTFTPAGYVLFAPFAALPYRSARLAWLAFGQLGVVATLVLWWRWLGPAPLTLAAGLIVALGFQPVFENVAVGQMSLLMLALVALAAAGHVSGRPLVAAVAVSWAAHLKPHYALLIPLLYMLGARVAAALALALAVAWIGLAALVFGTWWMPAWWTTFRDLSASSWLHVWPGNISPHAILHRLLRTEGFAEGTEALAIAFAAAIVVAVILATSSVAGAGRDAKLGAWSLALAAIPLVSPLTEEHHLAVLLLPCLMLLAAFDRLPRVGAICLAGGIVLVASRYSVQSFAGFASGIPSLAYAGKAVGAALLGVAGASLAQRAEQPT